MTSVHALSGMMSNVFYLSLVAIVCVFLSMLLLTGLHS
jgi:hypothetical protein